MQLTALDFLMIASHILGNQIALYIQFGLENVASGQDEEPALLLTGFYGFYENSPRTAHILDLQLSLRSDNGIGDRKIPVDIFGGIKGNILDRRAYRSNEA